MENIKGLEIIKRQMEENIETLMEFHKFQLEMFENIMNLSDIDEIDNAIADSYDEFEFSTLMSEIKQSERDNFTRLMDLAWDIKCNSLIVFFIFFIIHWAILYSWNTFHFFYKSFTIKFHTSTPLPCIYLIVLLFPH